MANTASFPTDARLTASKAPTSDLGITYRDNDRANACKPMCSYDPGEGSGAFTSVKAAATTVATWYVYVPNDVPSGYVLHWPVRVKMVHNDPSSPQGYFFLSLGANDGGDVSTNSTSYVEKTPSVEVPTAARGTATTLTLKAYTPGNSTLGVGDKSQPYARGATAYYAGLASVRSS